MADASVPKDWDKFLHHIAGALTAVESTLAKTASWETADPDPAATGSAQLVQDCANQQAALAGKADAVAHWVNAIESELRVSEDLLRVLLNQTESVRQSLAAWAGRAIG